MDRNQITIVFLVILSIRFSICVITDVQLVGGPDSNKGTIEIKIDNGTWETICGTNTDTFDVVVICKHLGFKGANRAIPETPYGQNSTPKHGLFCDENDPSLSECSLVQSFGCSSAGAASCHGDGYLGCFVDMRNDSALSGESLTNSPSITISYCIQFCNTSITANYTYAGVENGNECYCGEGSDNYTRHGLGSDVNCQFPCQGDPTESCGGVGYIAVFTNFGAVVGEGVVIIILSVLLIVSVIYIIHIRKMMKDLKKDQKMQHVDLVQSSNSPEKDTGFYHDIEDVRKSDPATTSDGDIHYSSQIYDQKR
ncbi:neurotrypsin-like isoform X3 [Lytechinus variegatus]|uniref:neurotrypsin-like isoform X3 n=1 Tax=Lytechinus variegatus TaxID=7654 RepID=UPI001BB184D0|nr:neurotrypsin-like isoform X3 [Lytechinus variegatus]